MKQLVLGSRSYLWLLLALPFIFPLVFLETGTGGVLAILSWVIGVLFIGRGMAKSGALAIRAASAPEPERSRMLAEAGALRKRAMIVNRLVAILLVITIVLMSVAHYL